MEQLVRPFQTPITIADKQTIVTSVIVESPQKAILTWGAAGTQPKPYSTGLNFKVVDPFKYEEYERSTTNVTISNPDDSSQFVTAQRIDKISFKKKPTLLSPDTEPLSGASSGSSTTVVKSHDSGSGVSDTAGETTKTPNTNTDESHTYVLKPNG